MELKNRKYINNTGNLPGFADGKQGYNTATSLINSINPWVLLGAWAGGGFAEGLGAKKSQEELSLEAGIGTGNIGGIGYTYQKGIDVSDTMKEYDKQTWVSMASNPFKTITMLANRGSLKKEAERQALSANNSLQYARSGAVSEYLQNEWLQKNGDGSNQLLHVAEGKKPVATAQGIKKAKPNAMTAPGEVIVSTKDGSVFENPGYASGKDVIPSIIRDSDAVLSSLHGGAQYFKNTGDLEGALYIDLMGRNMKGYKCGKKPKKHYADGLPPVEDAKYDFWKTFNLNLAKINDEDIDRELSTKAWQLPNVDFFDTNKRFDRTSNVYDRYVAPYKDDIMLLDGGESAMSKSSRSINKNTYRTYAMAHKVNTIPTVKPNISIPDKIDPNTPVFKNAREKANQYFSNSKNNKPEFISPWGNFAITTLGSLAGLGLMIDAATLKPYKPNTYVPNKYERTALNTLRGLKINPYSILPHLYNNYGRTVGAINTSGGLSAGQRAAARISAMNTTQQNTANTLQQIQHQNNQYGQGWAQASLTSGLNDAQRMTGAIQHDISEFAKAHGNRLQGMEMGKFNSLNAWWQGLANEYKRIPTNYSMAQYDNDYQFKKQYIKHLI